MSVKTITNQSNDTVAAHYSPEILMDGLHHLAIQLKANASTGTGIAFKIWGTLNATAATPADLDAEPSKDWSDITESMFEELTITLGESGDECGIYVENTSVMLTKYIIQYTPTIATNTVEIMIRKY